MQDDIRSIDELTLENQRVFVRADLDVRLKQGVPNDERRLHALLPTVKKAQSAGARLVLGARLGRPRGRPKPELSLEAVGGRLSELLEVDIFLPDETIGAAARKVVQDLRPGQICLLENLDFCSEEQANDEAFARKLAALADVFVNDDTRGLGERSASVVQLPRLVRQRGMGYALAAELQAFSRLREPDARPFVAVFGGVRVAEQMNRLEALFGRADAICVGGALGNTLLAASGHQMGVSIMDAASLARGRALLERARERRTRLVLPLDVSIAESSSVSSRDVVLVRDVPKHSMALDIGPRTIEAFQKEILAAKSALFYGALGDTDDPSSIAGTREVARALAESAAFSVVGGEGPLSALEGVDWASRLSFVSLGGAASLELFVGQKLPGLEALRGGAT